MSAGRAALAGLARVKNEADIVEAFVRHHAALLDHLVVVETRRPTAPARSSPRCRPKACR